MSKKTKYINLKSDFIDEQHWDTICTDLEVPTKCAELRVFTDFVVALDIDETFQDRAALCRDCGQELDFN